jgi:hypothetical protein
MPRDILSEYGNDIPKPQAARATTGGVKEAKPISNYCPPQGPSNINDPKSPGLHGDSHGMARSPSAPGSSGSPGLGGTVHRSGSQRG